MPSSHEGGTRKVVINACFGGFGLTALATEKVMERKGKKVWWFKHNRTSEGRLDFDNIVPTTTPDEDFVAFSCTTPEYSEKSHFSDRDFKRDDPDLVAVVEELGDAASDRHAKLRVIEIPADVEWEIDEYDGLEQVEEAHQVWS